MRVNTRSASRPAEATTVLNRPGLMRAVQHPEQLPHHRPHGTIEWRRQRLTLHGMEDTQTGIDDGSRFGGIEGKLPMK